MHPDPSVIMETENTTMTPAHQPDSTSTKPVSFWRRMYRPLGFKKGYNVSLWIIFAGAMFGFSLARLSYLNIGGSSPSSFASGSSPGEWYWYNSGFRRVGLTLHLGAILPVGLLMIWQFVPAIRYRFLLFHRINGYAIILLVLIANVGALMICRHSFGGTLSTQAGVGTLVLLTTVSIAMAYYNIKRLQIDQHRSWMLRAMFYLGTIITLRLIMVVSAVIIANLHTYYTVRSCDEIAFIYGSDEPLREFYPQCGAPNGTVDGLVVVQAAFTPGRPERIGASLGTSFGMAMWLALFMHLVGVEIYLSLTPRESNRLRQVSYERQLERGYKHPGSAGLTTDRWGDADPWQPMTKVAQKV